MEELDYMEFAEPSPREQQGAAEWIERQFYEKKRSALVTVADYLPAVLDVAMLTAIANRDGTQNKDISEFIWLACKEYIASWDTCDWAEYRNNR
jgi:hypothetical protein